MAWVEQVLLRTETMSHPKFKHHNLGMKEFDLVGEKDGLGKK